jgi:hypothetical protein
MSTVNQKSFLFLSCVICLAVTSLNAAGTHPRLMFQQHEVPALRDKVQHEPWSLMYQALQDDLWKDSQARNPIDWTASNRDLLWPGQRAAFLYVISGDDTYAAICREVCRRAMDDPLWGLASTKGLTLYDFAYRVALMYDWCYNAPSWDTAFREEVSLKLREMADLIVDNGGTEQNKSPASNWQGIRGAAAAWTYLAIDDPYDSVRFEAAWNRVATYLRENLGTSADGRGWNIEGLGYTYYPMGDFIGAYGYAQWRNDPTRDLRTVTPAAPWNFWTVYATAVHMPGQNVAIHPDWGDDNAAAIFSGTLGQAFWWMPETFHPAMLYTYDNLVGPEGDLTWDKSRAGTIWSILFHPGWEQTQLDPFLLPSWQDGYIETGGNGYITWRNDTDGIEDIIAQTYTKLRGNMGHSGPDGLGFRIIGLDNAWAVGGGRYGPQINGQHAYYHSMNSLYPVEPGSTLTISGDSGSFVGDPVVTPDGSGHAVMQMARSNLNVHDWTRRFAADYSGRGGAEAVFIISDTSTDGRWWQMVTHEDNTIATNGNTFTITGANGNRMEGTIVYPTGASIITGNRIRGSTFNSFADVVSTTNDFLYFEGTEGDFLVVLTLVRDGEPTPSVSATGTWNGPAPSGTVQVGGLSLSINGDALSWIEPVIIASAPAIEVPENGTAQIQLSLSAAPVQPVELIPLILPADADADLFAIEETGLPVIFDSDNWNVPQPVTITSATDVDGLSNSATIRFYTDTVSALRPVDVQLVQVDAGPYPIVAYASSGGIVLGIPGSGKAANGTEVSLSAVADPGFIFSGWSDGVGSETPLRVFTATSAVSVEALFERAGRSTIEAIADAYVRDGGYANTNYGTETQLVVKSQPTAIGYNRETFLRFPLPSGSGEISQASLLLTLASVSDPKAIHRVHVLTDATWEESTITWNNRPAVGDFVATWVPDTSGTTYEIDITDAVVAALGSGQSSIELAVTADDLTYAVYASREFSDSGQRPRLRLQEAGAPPSFDEWATLQWPALDPSERAPDADADKNGIQNLMAYTVGDHSGLPRPVWTTDGLKIEWHRRAGVSGVDWSMQMANHPSGPWTLLPPSATQAVSSSGDSHTLQTRMPEQVDAHKLFFRLHVKQQ